MILKNHILAKAVLLMVLMTSCSQEDNLKKIIFLKSQQSIQTLITDKKRLFLFQMGTLLRKEMVSFFTKEIFV